MVTSRVTVLGCSFAGDPFVVTSESGLTIVIWNSIRELFSLFCWITGDWSALGPRGATTGVGTSDSRAGRSSDEAADGTTRFSSSRSSSRERFRLRDAEGDCRFQKLRHQVNDMV